MTYKSFAASKNFYREALDTDEAVDAWLKKFSEELWERITKDREKHNRAPTNVTISVNSCVGINQRVGCASQRAGGC